MVMLAAANMDPVVHDQPARLDLERKPNRHMSFGTGIHFCLGHQLARIEGACALQALFTRWPRLGLAVDPSQIHWRKRPGIRAIAKLPVIASDRQPVDLRDATTSRSQPNTERPSRSGEAARSPAM
jgi:cytochrome P450 PksS